MTADFEVLDVHHHVGNAFRALGGNLESAPELGAEEYAAKEIASRIEIMEAAAQSAATGRAIELTTSFSRES